MFSFPILKSPLRFSDVEVIAIPATCLVQYFSSTCLVCYFSYETSTAEEQESMIKFIESLSR